MANETIKGYRVPFTAPDDRANIFPDDFTTTGGKVAPSHEGMDNLGTALQWSGPVPAGVLHPPAPALAYLPEPPHPSELVMGHDGKPYGVLLPSGEVLALATPDEVA